MLLRVLVALLFVLIIGAAVLWQWWSGWEPSRDDYPMQGITVSAQQGDIAWGAVRTQGVDFAYIRATSPDGKRDPSFADNWKAAQEAGLRYGAELLYDPCKRAADQATLFITTVPRDNAALPPVVNIMAGEHCPNQPGRDAILSELNTLLNLVETHGGKAALIRISPAVETRYELSSGINRTLWLERNYFLPDYAAHPWVMWTASDARRIEGIEGPVEWDVVAP
ncbi:MAG: glycoside hydrolase family 25 [Sphingobium sp.]|nr:glycoside hydrolase family 25 [Sphingobium sp.]